MNSFRDSPTGTLRLNVPTIVANEILPPLVNCFLSLHPGISLEVMANNSFIDVPATGLDAGIRYEERLKRDMIAVLIGPRLKRYVAAAAPSHLAARGTPKHPRDLIEHACIRHRFVRGMSSPSSSARARWPRSTRLTRWSLRPLISRSPLPSPGSAWFAPSRSSWRRR